MAFQTFLFIFVNVPAVFMYRHQKPVAEKVWSQYCTRNSVALNDCNWCHCDSKNQYACKARICQDVDMFGHFNDAIKEVDVGMEGHGVWRTTSTACEPGVHYKKSDLLCVCSEDGTWPNPVCRDIFRVLHTVEVTKYTRPSENQTCTPNKLHLIGCNACICPSSGSINPKYCTKQECDERPEEPVVITEPEVEVYATCNTNKKYALGVKACRCLRNNRLLCDNITKQNHPLLKDKSTLCDSVTPKAVFEKECNLCYCDNNTMYCSTKRCLTYTKMNIKEPEIEFRSVKPPVDDSECIPGTAFNKDCNTCECFLMDGVKNLRCTANPCQGSSLDTYRDCVVGTFYEKDCRKCHCFEQDGVKIEVCSVGRCNKDTKDLSTMKGYCEPLHSYRKDCNKCRCLADGKTVACTTKVCKKKPLVLELIPVLHQSAKCPNGHSYAVDCNYCFCVNDGNAICTTFKCN